MEKSRDTSALLSDKDLFRADLHDRCAEFEHQLILLERSLADGASLGESASLILRNTNSIKGALGAGEHAAAARCVHAMESAFMLLRDSPRAFSRPLVDLALAVLDKLRELADRGALADSEFDSLGEQWQSVQGQPLAPAEKPRQRLPFLLSDGETEILHRVLADGQELYLVEKIIQGGMDRGDFDSLTIYEDIAVVGTLVARRPLFEELDTAPRKVMLLLLVASPHDPAVLARRISDPIAPVELDDVDKRKYARTLAKPAYAGLRSLVVEDDLTSRLMLRQFLAPFGEAQVAVDGEQAIKTVRLALESGKPFQLVCLDIMMPKLDGHQTLRALRDLEESHGIPSGHGAKVIMTTSVSDTKQVLEAFREQCDAYVVKPVDRGRLIAQLTSLGLLRM